MKSEFEQQLEEYGEAVRKSAEKLFKDPRYIKILNEAMTEYMFTGQRNDEKYYEKIRALIKEMNNEERI